MAIHNWEHRANQLRRATVARSALDVIALIFLFCSFAFWSVAFYQLLAPPSLLHPLMIQVAVLAIVYALATPLLWSALVPTTPAGQLLQKTQWRTFGFAAIIGAAFYLSYQGEMLIETWLASQPNVESAGMARSLALSLTIAFVLIPALAWTQLTPERWLAQIQQAHQVRKLELMHNGEIAIIKSRLLWAEQRATMSYANLLPAEQKEVRDVLQGLFMHIADTQRGIARTLGISAEIERVYPTMDDTEIADRMAYLAGKLDVPAQQIEGALMSREDEDRLEHIAGALPRQSPPAPAAHGAYEGETHQNAIPVSPAVRGDAAPHASPPRPAAPRREARRYAAEYDAMRTFAQRSGGGVWGVGDLAVVIDKSDRSARERITAWMEEGLVARDPDSKNAYYFTESEGA